MKTRVCKKCGEVRPADDFHVHHTWCNGCAGFESQYSPSDEVSGISSYTGRKSKIIAHWNNKVRQNKSLLTRARQRDADTEYVYVLYCHEMGAHKIGYTGDFRKRHQSLCSSTGCYLKLKYVIDLATTIDEPAAFIEQFMKDYFADKKIRNEWFKLNKSDLKEIEDLFYNIGGEYIYTETLPFLIHHWSRRHYVQIG